MGREVENLLKENNELLETKNALNIVKNDLIARVDELSSEQHILRGEIQSLEMVKVKMSERIKELETEVRVLKEKVDMQDNEEEQKDIPVAQRKRFTRVEMARIVMERNQFKEKLIDLQDAMKWTELQRAKKLSAMQSNKSSGRFLWEFFSGLFSHDVVPHRAMRRPHHSAPSKPRSRRKATSKNVDFMDSDLASERRAVERQQQYKIVREHIRKEEDSGRIHAYGWSFPPNSASDADLSSVPVPIWCASGVTLYGGKDADNQYINAKSISDSNDGRQLFNEQNENPLVFGSSSVLWVCSSNQEKSYVGLLDCNNPNGLIGSFPVHSQILCVSSVPGNGAQDSECVLRDDEWKKFVRGGGYVKDLPSDITDQDEFGTVQWIELRKMDSGEDATTTYCGLGQKPSPKRSRDCVLIFTSELGLCGGLNSISEIIPTALDVDEKKSELSYIPLEKLKDAGEGDVNSYEKYPNKIVNVDDNENGGYARLPRYIKDQLVKYEDCTEETLISQPTMWLGTQNDYILIHSAVKDWHKCLRRIKMADAVLCIQYYEGHVFAALANGSIAVFHRSPSGEWMDGGYHLITVGRATSSVRSLAIVAGYLWAAYRNCIIIINPKQLVIEKAITVHPRRDSQVRHMQWIGDGVWLSIRLDSTLRLYHAYTHAHLQDMDIAPYLTRMLGTDNLDLAYMRTTALLASCRRLWIGTGTGLILSVPLCEKNAVRIKTDFQSSVKDGVHGPGGLMRVYAEAPEGSVNQLSSISSSSFSSTFIPYCNMANAQLSFHGHKDSVKFLLAVPGSEVEFEKDESTNAEAKKGTIKIGEKMLIASGGDGYIDFRAVLFFFFFFDLGEEEDSIRLSNAVRPRDMPHLILWKIPTVQKIDDIT
uniref:RH2 domain-containing protein n=1 Tax=Syphacia muris TaxID=451379 RepID=A0A0N5AD21_9BILA